MRNRTMSCGALVRVFTLLLSLFQTTNAAAEESLAVFGEFGFLPLEK